MLGQTPTLCSRFTASLRRLAEKTQFLVVTHNREIARVADRIVELSSGRIESDWANEPAAMADVRW